MSEYRPPNQDMMFTLQSLIDIETLSNQLGLEGIDAEMVGAILDEAGRLGSEVLAPLNEIGDREGVKLTPDGVQETAGFADAYAQFVDNGWPSLTAPEEFGGQSLPNVLGMAVNEIWHAANMSFALCPMLTQGAIEALTHHGSEQLQQLYLPKLISGEWTGTMDLTEPDAGSDLAALKAKAMPEDDHYLISGQKIFITWGDHQMAENIVHLVLARLPDAPAGVKGISLFIVPKFIPDADGNPGARNDMSCVSLEHKLGIHASPTCVMSYGDNEGAIAYLVGEPHNGLACMFTMMNHARQNVGLEGVAVSDRAYRQSADYARERLQGTRRDGSRYPIIDFPDVRRMLMQMRASTEASRGLMLLAAAEIDRVNAATDEADKAFHQARADLLTPIVKGWITELSQEVTYLGIQVYGGMGYVEETGLSQFYRDARVLTIYEGTTGIQATDLAGRKTVHNNGEWLNTLLDEMRITEAALEAIPALAARRQHLASAIQCAVDAEALLLKNAATDRAYTNSVCYPFLMLMGYLSGGWVLAQESLAAQKQLDAGGGDTDFLNAKITTTAFYFDQLLVRCQAYLATIESGSESLLMLPAEHF